MERITITIDPVGNPTVEAHGFSGTRCQDATKPILDALSDPADRETSMKAEVYGNDTEQEANYSQWA